MEQIILEPVSKLEPKTLDAWSQSQTLKFQFRPHSPALGYLAYDRKMHLLIETYFSCFSISNVFHYFVKV